MTREHLYIAVYLWLTASLFLSCSQETRVGSPEGGLCTLSITVTAQAKEDEILKQDATPYEYMSDILFFIVSEANGDQKGTIEFAAYQEFSKENVKEAVITTDKQIPTGKKKIYVFSNFKTFEELGDNNDKHLVEELFGAHQEYMEDTDTSVEFPFTAKEMSSKTVSRLPADLVYTTKEDGKYMPMSYAYTFEAQEGPQEIGPLPLIRMFAKIKVSITNETGQKITFNDWKIEYFRNDKPLFLLPYKDLDQESVAEDLKPVLPSDDAMEHKLTLGANGTSVQANETIASILYVKEGFSTSDRSSSIPYVVSLTPTSGLSTTKTLYGHSQYTYIRRNDYMILPLILKEGKLLLTLTSLKAPIGGLPQTIVKQIGISDQYYCEVSGKDGLFYIEMEFYQQAGQSVKLTKDEIKLGVTQEDPILGTLPGSSTGELVRFNPAPDNKNYSGYIEGFFSGKSGNTTITLTLTLSESDERTYTIHITKK
ncbi:hypothetical protein [Parabacteroides sp.]